LTEPDEELGRQQWSTGSAGTGAKSLSVYDMSGDDLTMLHKKLHNDGGSEVSTKSRGFFASAWSNQTAYREAKKGSIGSLVEMQQQQSTQPYRSLSRTEPSLSAAEVSTSTSSASSTAPADSIWGFFSKSRTNTLSDSVGAGEETQGYQRVSSSPTSTTEGERESESEKGGDGSFLFRSGTAGGEGGAEVVRRTEFLVLDFSETTGIDATATKSCFLRLSQLMKASKVTVVFANMPRSIEQLFASNGVTRDGDVVIRHLDDALEWCEEQVLANSLREGLVGGHRDRGLLRDPSYYASAWRRRHGDTSSSGSSLSFSKSLSSSASGSQSEGLGSAPGSPFRSDQSEAERMFAKHSRALRKIFEDHLELTAKDDLRVAKLLTPSLLGLYFVRSTVPANATLFDLSERADHIYFLEDGEVELVSVTTDTNLTHNGEGREGVERVSKAGPGSIFGEATFFLGACQCLKAITLSDCSVWSLSREDLAMMEDNHPPLCMLCQLVLLKSMSINSASSLYKLYPETAFSTSLFDDG
jgi:CRP-like cAMP-binding protein